MSETAAPVKGTMLEVDADGAVDENIVGLVVSEACVDSDEGLKVDETLGMIAVLRMLVAAVSLQLQSDEAAEGAVSVGVVAVNGVVAETETLTDSLAVAVYELPTEYVAVAEALPEAVIPAEVPAVQYP
ncbi:MAG: hypothetical protein Q9227_004431 [Pyrenula ochraceoflavens]